jgi:hypothetical protein
MKIKKGDLVKYKDSDRNPQSISHIIKERSDWRGIVISFESPDVVKLVWSCCPQRVKNQVSREEIKFLKVLSRAKLDRNKMIC